MAPAAGRQSKLPCRRNRCQEPPNGVAPWRCSSKRVWLALRWPTGAAGPATSCRKSPGFLRALQRQVDIGMSRFQFGRMGVDSGRGQNRTLRALPESSPTSVTAGKLTIRLRNRAFQDGALFWPQGRARGQPCNAALSAAIAATRARPCGLPFNGGARPGVRGDATRTHPPAPVAGAGQAFQAAASASRHAMPC